MSAWRPALRMARRDLRRHPVRAVLTCLLVALPVLVATVAALAVHNGRWDPEQAARQSMASADAQVVVTPWAALRPRQALLQNWVPTRPAEKRPRTAVDLAALLPAGSVTTPAPTYRQVPLATGGAAQALLYDTTSPLNRDQVTPSGGRMPAGADEVAVSRPAAEALGLLVGDEPAPDASLRLADGTSLRVVGTFDSASLGAGDGSLALLAPPEGVLAAGARRTWESRVALPDLDRAALRDLQGELAAAGVAFTPRDAVLHPQAWGLPPTSSVGEEAKSLVVATVVVVVGLLEVVLLVGAAFAVAARRQTRDLGLLASNGGAGQDVRRVLLAQGVVLGVGSSLAGMSAGLLAFRWLAPHWLDLFGTDLWRRETDWPALVLVVVLGSLSSVVAAMLPAWSVARLTPVAALSGRFPVSTRESRAHRGAFVLAGAGLVLLALGGWATARTFRPGGREQVLAPFVAGLGLVLLVAGVFWAAPYAVRRAAAVGRVLPLSGRYAFRAAARHRFRTAAAVTALTITVGAAVLAGFGTASAAAAQERDTYAPPNTFEASFGGRASPARLERLEQTVEGLVGPVEVSATRDLGVAGRPGGWVEIGRGRWTLVSVDDRTVAEMVAALPAEDAASVQAAFAGGEVLLTTSRARAGVARRTVPLRVHHGDRTERRTVEAVTLPSTGVPGERNYSALVSAAGASRLGLVPRGAMLEITAQHPFTSSDLTLLRAHGVNGWSADPDRLAVQRLQFAGVVVAGLVSLVVVGVAVALAAAESRDEVATLAAVGAAPWRRRSMGAAHGLFIGSVACGLGLLVGVPGGLALTQVDGLPGMDVPWLATLGTLVVVAVAAPLAGWVVTPSRLRMTRRTA